MSSSAVAAVQSLRLSAEPRPRESSGERGGGDVERRRAAERLRRVSDDVRSRDGDRKGSTRPTRKADRLSERWGLLALIGTVCKRPRGRLGRGSAERLGRGGDRVGRRLSRRDTLGGDVAVRLLLGGDRPRAWPRPRVGDDGKTDDIDTVLYRHTVER
jgi:hypothetical protein